MAPQPLLHSHLASATFETPIGKMIAVTNDEGLLLLEFGDRRALSNEMQELRNRFGGEPARGESAHIASIQKELDAYFARELQRFETPVVLWGSDFQVRVWGRLQKISYGTTVSYGEIGREFGIPDAPRAVGKANGENRLAIIVPCHRVIGSDGSLTGYGGGLWRKKCLLDLESGSSSLFSSGT